MIGYLEELAKGQCSRTHPRAVISALYLFKTTGGHQSGGSHHDVRADHQHALIAGTVADVKRELGMGAKRSRRKAPHHPVFVVAAFKDQVCNVKIPEYKRIYV